MLRLVGISIIDIIGYKQTTFQKIVQANNTQYFGSGPSVQKIGRSFVWKNTVAITELTFTAGHDDRIR